MNGSTSSQSPPISVARSWTGCTAITSQTRCWARRYGALVKPDGPGTGFKTLGALQGRQPRTTPQVQPTHRACGPAVSHDISDQRHGLAFTTSAVELPGGQGLNPDLAPSTGFPNADDTPRRSRDMAGEFEWIRS